MGQMHYVGQHLVQVGISSAHVGYAVEAVVLRLQLGGIRQQRRLLGNRPELPAVALVVHSEGVEITAVLEVHSLEVKREDRRQESKESGEAEQKVARRSQSTSSSSVVPATRKLLHAGLVGQLLFRPYTWFPISIPA